MISRAVAVFAFLSLLCAFPRALAQTDPGREVAIVIRVAMPAAFDTRGREVASTARRAGEIARRLAALRTDELEAVPYALTFAGVTCDELRLMKNPTARKLIGELRLQARSSPILPSTYADIRLSDVSLRDIGREVTDGERAMQECTRAQPRSLFVPPDLSLPDSDILEPVRRAGAVVAMSSFAVPLAQPRPTIVPAVELDTEADLTALRSARPESPSIAVVLDTEVHDVASILRMLADDERFALRNVGALAKLDVVRGMIDPAPGSSGRYRRSVADASRALEDFQSFTLPENPLAAVYRTVLARIRGSAEWNPEYDVARRRAEALTRALVRQRRLVSVSDGSVTFTSSRGSIPVTVANRAPYPVRVRVEVSSPKLDFPGGQARVVTVNPPGDTITFDAIARSTGTFPTTVAVKSQRGDLPLGRGELTVRSTAANVSAVVLTAGGALFLIAWFFRRARQRHVAGARS